MGQEYEINSDTLLWNDFLKGNEDSFRIIYNKYVQPLFKYGCHFTHDKELIKDCIQDVFIDLAKYRSGLGSTNNIKLYLFKSLKRRIIRSLEVGGNNGTKDIEKIPFEYSVSTETEMDESDFEQLRYQQLTIALANLSPRQREAIYLKFVSELSYEELSKIMNLNYQSSRNLVFRGLEKLRGSFPKNMYLFFLH